MFTSAFDLYRIGPGPSSAHTVGSMRAARRFVRELESNRILRETRQVHVDLYGSVACAGRNQGADRAILSGLCGDAPDAVDSNTLASRAAHIRAEGQLPLAGSERIPFDLATDIVFHVDNAFADHSNALRFIARNARGEELTTRLYFSAGDGRIQADGEAPDAAAALRVPYLFDTAAELLSLGQTRGKKIGEMMRTNELALRSPAEVHSGLLHISAAMRSAIERGLATGGTLPGGHDEPRRAATLAAALSGTDPMVPAWASAYATAVAEENAAGGRVVAAPSNGSAGPVAAALHQWRITTLMANDEGTVTFLLAAAAVGHLLRRGGLEHSGCQGEVGVAAAMAAAGLAAVNGASNGQVLFAAEHALNPHIGLTCDPVGGLVQHPCIVRNAAAAAHAVQAARLALRQPDPPPVALDALIHLMVEASRAMAHRGKETTLGGIALNVVDC